MKDQFKMNVVKNKSLTYMFPMLNEIFSFKFTQFLLNSYMAFEKGDNIFCVLYKWSSDPEFLKFEKEIMEHPLYMGHADFGEKVAYKFKLTALMEIEKNKFIKGDYKRFSQEHKNAVGKYVDFRSFRNASRIKRIMTEGDSLVSDPPLKEKETLMCNVKKIEYKIDSFD